MVNTTKTAASKTEETVNEATDTVRKITDAAPAREMAEKTVQQAKDGYARFKSAAEETTDALEDAYATASKGYKDLGRKSVELTRSNINAHFDFLNALLAAKSVSQAIELQTSYARQQANAFAGQAKELSALAQKAASEGAKPLQNIATKSFSYAKAS
jgi:phasin